MNATTTTPSTHHGTPASGRGSTDTGPRVLLTVEAAAARLSISRTRMYQLLATGDITSVKIGRLRRIPTTELDAFATRLLNNQPAA